MLREYCPRCQSLQNMDIINTEGSEKDEKGRIIKFPVIGFQCSVCKTFVKSEEKAHDFQNGRTKMLREYCPRCQSLQNMDIINTEGSEKDEKGRIIKFPVIGFQCSVCKTFLKSEEIK